MRAWAEHARDAFNDVRNSPDPVLRDHWWKLHRKRILKAQSTLTAKKACNVKQYLHGVKETIKVSKGGEMAEIHCGMFRFTISQKLQLNLVHGDKAVLQLHLLSTQHPHPYATRASSSDPASRLGVAIRGEDKQGDFHCWLATSGELNVWKMNTLVDILEGYSLEESRGFKRRWFHKKYPSSGGGRNVYA